ncbi:uncharacterized protein IL334_003949 [Kwoniella shivajii]|uniref:Uncharacterized protein n=1 Tax=Kwoniella shivajii TaxID=564305 RepID=A0ABZ1CZ00_9TREE|nr:hypothetical protein IL334_003949 [Kwoniella shivajii]
MERRTVFAIRRACRSTLTSSAKPLIRSIHSSTRGSANQHPNANQNPSQSPSAYALRMQSLLNTTSRRPNHSSSLTVPLHQPWPWQEIPSSSQDSVILQRTLFARPPDFAPPLLLFAAGIWGLFVFAWLVLPEPPRKELSEEDKIIIRENERKTKEANVLSRLGLGFTNALFSSAQPLIYGLVTLGLVSMMIASTKIITRINMIQIKPRDSTDTGKTVLRMTNVGHEMIPWRSNKMREVKVEDCKVYIPNLNNPQTIRLKVRKEGKPDKWSLDRFPYSLDYRAIPETSRTDKEIVQSVNRLEHVFGPLKMGE